ncbi:protein ETHYLENE INSENSITIVE 3-like protein [Cinnamomum micranthum f. kanehirae]|uniref:Protein ETHYLENE INSENSITIVE 3-like protein n=1 Tax=Cinnamomum micranthum f. kanehirae TaxID=337451 RepID=A0A443N452_9MAGN|nr:protein ETHYLENE INSENSITIVE 3-like protein [Cinnamomum micranthum f. kanehirae]
MEHYDRPQRNCHFAHEIPPTWWPKGDDEWWNQVGIPSRPQYRKPHDLKKDWKTTVLIVVIKHLVPGFTKIRNLVCRFKGHQEKMTARESTLWVFVINKVESMWRLLHPTASPPSSSTMGTFSTPHINEDDIILIRKDVPDDFFNIDATRKMVALIGESSSAGSMRKRKASVELDLLLGKSMYICEHRRFSARSRQNDWQSFESILTGIDTDFQFGTSFQQLLAIDFTLPSSREEDRGGICQRHENPSLDITGSIEPTAITFISPSHLSFPCTSHSITPIIFSSHRRTTHLRPPLHKPSPSLHAAAPLSPIPALSSPSSSHAIPLQPSISRPHLSLWPSPSLSAPALLIQRAPQIGHFHLPETVTTKGYKGTVRLWPDLPQNTDLDSSRHHYVALLRGDGNREMEEEEWVWLCIFLIKSRNRRLSRNEISTQRSEKKAITGDLYAQISSHLGYMGG